jgi:hypothetical protein
MIISPSFCYGTVSTGEEEIFVRVEGYLPANSKK